MASNRFAELPVNPSPMPHRSKPWLAPILVTAVDVTWGWLLTTYGRPWLFQMLGRPELEASIYYDRVLEPRLWIGYAIVLALQLTWVNGCTPCANSSKAPPTLVERMCRHHRQLHAPPPRTDVGFWAITTAPWCPDRRSATPLLVGHQPVDTAAAAAGHPRLVVSFRQLESQAARAWRAARRHGGSSGRQWPRVLLCRGHQPRSGCGRGGPCRSR